MSTPDTPGSPDTPDDAFEQALRARLREVDDLVPPPVPDFAARAVAAARDSSPDRADDEDGGPLAPVVPLHRRGWAKALVGVAATVVLGAGVVAGLQHLGSGGASSASSAVAGAAADGSTERPAPAVVPQGAASTGPASAGMNADGGAVTLSSMRATGAVSTPLPDAVARLQQRLLRPPYDAAKATVALDGTMVVVTVPTPAAGRPAVDPALADLVAGLLPSGTLVEYRAR